MFWIYIILIDRLKHFFIQQFSPLNEITDNFLQLVSVYQHVVRLALFVSCMLEFFPSDLKFWMMIPVTVKYDIESVTTFLYLSINILVTLYKCSYSFVLPFYFRASLL